MKTKGQIERLELLDTEYCSLALWVKTLTPEANLTPAFQKNWADLLDYHEKRLLILVENEVRKSHQAPRLIKRGWSFAETETKILSHSTDDPGDLPKVETVMVSIGGRWHPPRSLVMATALHPTIVQVSKETPPRSVEEQIKHKLSWARSLKDNLEITQLNEHELLLAQAAEAFDLAMYIPMGMDEEMGWLSNADKKDSFWNIIQSAIDFGRRSALFEVYGDGRVEDLAKASLVNPPGRGKSQWHLLLLEIISPLKESKKATGPAAILKILGGKRGTKGDHPKLIFEDPRASKLPEIEWNEFQSLVKSVKQTL
ncbi:hypothetical protein [Luteolibacter sp. AS25]|uniref:hypothetical protein n=1 Tax=Luteolibacter sp. AS25 TaxID=3135776 RepID=UPI00398A9424